MRHRHVPGWKLCDYCGIQAPAGCPPCMETHVRLHHYKRRIRRAEKMRGGKR